MSAKTTSLAGAITGAGKEIDRALGGSPWGSPWHVTVSIHGLTLTELRELAKSFGKKVKHFKADKHCREFWTTDFDVGEIGFDLYARRKGQ